MFLGACQELVEGEKNGSTEGITGESFHRILECFVQVKECFSVHVARIVDEVCVLYLTAKVRH